MKIRPSVLHAFAFTIIVFGYYTLFVMVWAMARSAPRANYYLGIPLIISAIVIAGTTAFPGSRKKVYYWCYLPLIVLVIFLGGIDLLPPASFGKTRPSRRQPD